MAMRWIILNSRAKVGRSMEVGLTQELVDCFNNQGATIKKKDDTHRMAEAIRLLLTTMVTEIRELCQDQIRIV